MFPTSEKALKNHVLNLQIRLKTDLLETHAIQMKIVLTKIAIMEFAKQNASLMRTVASSNPVQWEAISFIQNAFRLRMRERTVTKRWPTLAVLWLCAIKENVFDSFPFLLTRALSFMQIHRSIKIKAISVTLGMRLLLMTESIDVNSLLFLIKTSLLLTKLQRPLFALIKRIQFLLSQIVLSQESFQSLLSADSTRMQIYIALGGLEIVSLNTF